MDMQEPWIDRLPTARSQPENDPPSQQMVAEAMWCFSSRTLNMFRTVNSEEDVATSEPARLRRLAPLGELTHKVACSGLWG